LKLREIYLVPVDHGKSILFYNLEILF